MNRARDAGGKAARMNREEYINGGHRQTQKRGADLPQSKLTPDLVRMIRASSRTAPDLARELDVHRRTVESVRSYHTWVHVL